MNHTKRYTKLLALGTLALAIHSGLARADESAAAGPNLGPTAADVGLSAVSHADAAMTMAQLGQEQKDPVLLAAAARALLIIGATEGQDAPTEGDVADTDKPATGEAADKPETAQVKLPERLLTQARQLARGNEQTLAMIEAAATVSSRGNIKGPHVHNLRISARRYQDLTERFLGGQLAEVAIKGDGDTDVDLVVFDQNGKRICRSTRRSDAEYCSWTPAWTGNFTIRVGNLGRIYNDVTLITN